MRVKCTAMESARPQDVVEDTVTVVDIVEDERVLILSTEEEIFLNQHRIDHDMYYEARRSFLEGGESGLRDKLATLSLDNNQQEALVGFTVERGRE